MNKSESEFDNQSESERALWEFKGEEVLRGNEMIMLWSKYKSKSEREYGRKKEMENQRHVMSLKSSERLRGK